LHGGDPAVTRVALLIALFALTGCGSNTDEQACMGTVKSAIVGGGTRAELLAAGAEQTRAVVEIVLDAPPAAVCSGVVIAPDHVLTAKHCAEAATVLGVRVDAGAFAPALEQHWHPELDLVLIELAPGSTTFEPIAAGDEPLGPSFVGSPAQIAGHGAGSPDGAPGFLAVTIDGVSAHDVSVNAAGLGGACLGDSGGPLLARGADGSVRAIGILRAGSATCRGQDHYTRLDAAASFLEPLVGPPRSDPAPACGTLGPAGRCYGERAVWCESGVARAADCAAPFGCGWDAQAGGFRCVDPRLDPCAGVDDLGVCEGDVAVRCEGGAVERSSCASCGGSCGRSPSAGRAGCNF
jgi:hypothetical protein